MTHREFSTIVSEGGIRQGSVHRFAVLSDDEVYRYTLRRTWGSGKAALWIMLNPSTADALVDDPTITRVMEFSRRWGFGSATVINLFALRATDPKELTRHPDPVGPDNDAHIRGLNLGTDLTIVAWGAHRIAAKRAQQIEPLLYQPQCLGTNKDGSPKHPLYLRSDTPLREWRP